MCAVSTPLGMKIALKKLRYYVSPQTQVSVCYKQTAINSNKSRSSIPWFGIHEWRKAEQADWHADWPSKHSIAWAPWLCGHRTAIKCRKAASLLTFVLILAYDVDFWEMNEGVRPPVQAIDMGFLRRVQCVALRDKVRYYDVRKDRITEPFLWTALLWIERSQLRWSEYRAC